MSVSRLQNLQGDLQPIAQQYNRTVACTQAYYVQHYQDPKATSPFPDGCFIVIKDDTQSVMDSFIDQMYPVGTVYMNALVQTDPNVLFNHGVWSRITGKFLYAADGTTIQALDTGGASTVTLQEANLPVHTHTITPTGSISATFTGTEATTGNQSAHEHLTWSDNHTHIQNLQSTSSGQLTWCKPAAWSGSYNGINLSVTADAVSGRQAITTGPSSASIDQDCTGNHTHTFTASGSVSATFTGDQGTTSSVGSGTSFDIIPPYIGLNVWYRVS